MILKLPRLADISKLEIFEPVSVKEQIIKSATEVASMILRIDDVIASSKSSGGGMPPGRNATRWHGRNVNIINFFLILYQSLA